MDKSSWLGSYKHTYEYYEVDPVSWRDIKPIRTVTSCSINRDQSTETLGSATIDVTESLGECYIRVYLIILQNGSKKRYPLGTFLVQTPSTTFDGRIKTVSVDAYTPLIELKENVPPIGYSRLKGEKIMDVAYNLCNENARAPVIKSDSNDAMLYDFVADTNDTWLSFLSDFIVNAKREFALDELGRIMFAPVQDTASLQPVWTYTDDNSSILYPEITMEQDLYGIPNVVEVIYSDNSSNGYLYGKAVNDDKNSPISTINRGREIVKRITNPDEIGTPTQEQVQAYAERALRELSSVEYSITYTHGYCPVRLGDCVLFDYKRAGLTNIKSKVVSQTIKCETGCPVTEKAIFTTKLWR